jgi:hypothetical protein
MSIVLPVAGGTHISYVRWPGVSRRAELYIFSEGSRQAVGHNKFKKLHKILFF